MDMIKSKLISGAQFMKIIRNLMSAETTEENLVFCLNVIPIYIAKYIPLDNYA